MRGIGWIAVATVASLLSSGCSGGSASEAASPSKAPVDPDSIAVDDTNGVLQGHVYSEELVPIEGALVGLRGTESQDTTDADGLYVFTGVLPDTYVVDVLALGYEAAVKKVEVVAAQVAELDFSLHAVPITDEVYPETLHFAGFLECALGAVVFVAPCSYPYRAVYLTARNNGVNLSTYGAPPDIHANKFWINFTVKPNAKNLVAELVWTPASAAATKMQLFILCGDFDPLLNECTEKFRYGVATSVSPVRVRVPEKQFKLGCPASKFCLKDKPVWWANDAAMPFTDPEVAFQQKFEIWDTIFYNGEAPEDFTALPDH